MASAVMTTLDTATATSAIKETMRTTYVVCIEGCHGVGKSELCASVCPSSKVCVLEECFVASETAVTSVEELPVQGVANEALWVTLWYGRVLKALKLHTSVYGERPEVLITDRSPLSAKMYVKGPSNWVAPLTESIQGELEQLCGLHFCFVYVTAPEELLWSRIEERLKREPVRAAYREDQKEWMETVKRAYDAEVVWNCVISNTGSVEDMSKQLENFIRGLV